MHIPPSGIAPPERENSPVQGLHGFSCVAPGSAGSLLLSTDTLDVGFTELLLPFRIGRCQGGFELGPVDILCHLHAASTQFRVSTLSGLRNTVEYISERECPWPCANERF